MREVGSVPFINRNRFELSADAKLIATSDTAGNLVVSEVEPDLPKLELTHADVFDFHPNGKALAIGSEGGTVAVHLVTGGKPTFKLAALGAVKGLSYSPDGKRLAVGTRDPDGTETIRVYADNGAEPVAEIPGMSAPLAWLNSTALAVGNGTSAGVYDLTKKAFTGLIKEAPGAVAVSPDGTKLVATGAGGLRVRLWDLPAGNQLHAENDSFPDPALMVGTDDGALFLLASDTAYLWRLGATGAKAVGTLPGRAVSAAVSQSALAVATPDAVCVYTNFDPRKPLDAKPAVVLEKSARAKLVTLAPDGQRLAWADQSGAITVTNPTGRERRRLPVVTTSILALQFSPDGSKLAQFGRDGFLRLWAVGEKSTDPREVWKVRPWP